MKCMYQRVKSRDYKKYLYCAKDKRKITFEYCGDCKEKEYKKASELKKKSSKLAKLERNRFSTIQTDTEICFVCNLKKKLDKDEAFRRL